MEVVSTEKPSGQWQHWLIGLVTAAALWWLVGRSGEVTSVVQTISTGHWQWLALAGVVYAGSLSLASLNYKRAFAAVGISVGLREVLPTLLASLVVGEIAPFGWAAGSAVFLRFATRQGQSTSRAAVAILLAQAADLLAFSTLFLLGMLALFWGHHKLTITVLTGAVLLLLLNLAFMGALLLAVGRPKTLLGLGALLQRLVGAVAGKTAGEATLATMTKAMTGLVAAGDAIRESPKRLLGLLGAAGAANATAVLCLFFVFEAFHQPVAFGQLVMGFGMGTLAWIVSPIPAGIGVVEGAMALAFASLGILPTKAAVIAITYRGISFWLPFVIGLFTLHRQNSAPRG